MSTDLATENEALKSRIRELEQLLGEHERKNTSQGELLEKALADLRAQTQLLSSTVNSITDGVVIADPAGNVTHVNPAAMRLTPGTPVKEFEEWKKFGFFHEDGETLFTPDELPLVRALKGESVEKVDMLLRNEAAPEGIWIQASASPVRTEDGTMLGGVVIFRDITERKRWEQREREQHAAAEQEKNALLQRLQFAVRELSTPVLEVWDDVLVLPVIGIVDSVRSAEMMERLLEAVERRQCRFVIIDITGVEVIDSSTAHQFVKLVTAVEYLGARCVLTGTRSAVAQTLVSLGVELGQLTMLRTLKHGLRECLRRMDGDAPRWDARTVVEAARDRSARAPRSSGG